MRPRSSEWLTEVRRWDHSPHRLSHSVAVGASDGHAHGRWGHGDDRCIDVKCKYLYSDGILYYQFRMPTIPCDVLCVIIVSCLRHIKDCITLRLYENRRCAVRAISLSAVSGFVPHDTGVRSHVHTA